jgi:hypothetical protein
VLYQKRSSLLKKTLWTDLWSQSKPKIPRNQSKTLQNRRSLASERWLEKDTKEFFNTQGRF